MQEHIYTYMSQWKHRVCFHWVSDLSQSTYYSHACACPVLSRTKVGKASEKGLSNPNFYKFVALECLHGIQNWNSSTPCVVYLLHFLFFLLHWFMLLQSNMSSNTGSIGPHPHFLYNSNKHFYFPFVFHSNCCAWLCYLQYSHLSVVQRDCDWISAVYGTRTFVNSWTVFTFRICIP